MVLVGAVGVEKLHAAGAEDLEAVVEVGAGGKVLGAEAGAGVVDFEEFDGPAGAVADCGGDVRGMAAGCCEEGGEGDSGDGTHESKGYQADWGGFGCRAESLFSVALEGAGPVRNCMTDINGEVDLGLP